MNTITYTITKVGGPYDWMVYINTSEEDALEDYIKHCTKSGRYTREEIMKDTIVETFETDKHMWAYELTKVGE